MSQPLDFIKSHKKKTGIAYHFVDAPVQVKFWTQLQQRRCGKTQY